MEKDYNNREMKRPPKNTEVIGYKTKQQFFFPKENPPVTIEAESREEAEKLLNKKKNNG